MQRMDDRCARATEHGHARSRRVRESRPFSIRKSNRGHRTERPVSGAALTGKSAWKCKQNTKWDELLCSRQVRLNPIIGYANLCKEPNPWDYRATDSGEGLFA